MRMITSSCPPPHPHRQTAPTLVWPTGRVPHTPLAPEVCARACITSEMPERYQQRASCACGCQTYVAGNTNRILCRTVACLMHTTDTQHHHHHHRVTHRTPNVRLRERHRRRVGCRGDRGRHAVVSLERDVCGSGYRADTSFFLRYLPRLKTSLYTGRKVIFGERGSCVRC